MKPKNSLLGFKLGLFLLLAAVFAGNVTTASAHSTSLVSVLHVIKGLSVTVVPEPTTLALVGLAGLSLALFRRRHK
jgi:hypothetical protein